MVSINQHASGQADFGQRQISSENVFHVNSIPAGAFNYLCSFVMIVVDGDGDDDDVVVIVVVFGQNRSFTKLALNSK